MAQSNSSKLDPDVNYRQGGGSEVLVNNKAYPREDPVIEHTDLAELFSDFLDQEDIDAEDYTQLLFLEGRIDRPEKSLIKVSNVCWLFHKPQQIKKDIGEMKKSESTRDEVKEQVEDLPENEIGELAKQKMKIEMAREKLLTQYPVLIENLVNRADSEASVENVKNASMELRRIEEHMSQIEDNTRSIRDIPIKELEEELIRVIKEASEEAYPEGEEPA